MKDFIGKYKREPIIIIIVIGIVLFLLYVLISPYRKCMSSAPDKYFNMPELPRLHGQLDSRWQEHKDNCIKNTPF